MKELLMKTSGKNFTLKTSAVLFTVLPCYFIFSNYFDLVSSSGVFNHLCVLGFSLPAVLIPYSLVILCDSSGWLFTFGKGISRMSFTKLFLIRLATETLQTSLPGGAVYAELARPFLAKKHLNIDYSESITANIITKLNILIAQIIFFICGILVLLLLYKNNITQFFPSGFVFYAALFVFIALPFLSAWMFYRRNLLIHLIHLAEKIKLRYVKNFVDKIRKPAYDINRTIITFSQNHKKRLCMTIIFFLITWFMMAAESLVILKVIGVDADISQVILLESFLSFVRIIFFFIPGAFGPQDAAIILLFNLSGLPDPATNAFLFVLLKRFKELFWIAAGYILLFFLGLKPYKLIRSKRTDFAASTEMY